MKLNCFVIHFGLTHQFLEMLHAHVEVLPVHLIPFQSQCQTGSL